MVQSAHLKRRQVLRGHFFCLVKFAMRFCGLSLVVMPAVGEYQLWVAPIVTVPIAIFSTDVIEKPVSRWIRRKFNVGEMISKAARTLILNTLIIIIKKRHREDGA